MPRLSRTTNACLVLCAILPCLFSTWIAVWTTLSRQQTASSYREESLIQKDRELTASKNSNKVVFGAKDSPLEGCLTSNSKEWLDGPRLGNTMASGVDEEFAKSTILGLTSHERNIQSNPAQRLLRQSLCPKESRLLDDSTDKMDESLVDLWTVRLLYLVIHHHQHRHAIAEARRRLTASRHCQKMRRSLAIGPFDFECPSAKFLVVRLHRNGIGANLRLIAVPALMAGLASDRVVLFVNNAATGPSFLQNPWTLASCQRRDAQCFFLPASPCVLTEKELAAAHVLQRSDLRRLFRFGVVPDEHHDDRVVVLQLSFRPRRMPENLRVKLYNCTMDLVEKVPSFKGSSRRTLESAAQRILQDDRAPTNAFNYYGAESPLFHSLLLYAMRPNPESLDQIEEILNVVLPDDFDPETSMGLPIRGTRNMSNYQLLCRLCDFT